MKLSPESPVLLMGHPMLFVEQPHVTLDEIATEDFQENLRILRQLQIKTNGIGIAAPQLGWGARVLSLGISDENRNRYPQAPDIPFSFWINAQIVESSQETCWTWEACLSVPGMRAWIERPESVKVIGYDEQGQRQEAKFDGFHARLMQHELDHLNGILFPMRVEDKGLIIPNDAILRQDEWAEDWPTPNARNTPRGSLSKQR